MKIELDSLPNNEPRCLSTILPCFYQFQYPTPSRHTLFHSDVGRNTIPHKQSLYQIKFLYTLTP
jgi:hypothetical protein